MDIPAQSLATALRQLADQTGLQLVYESDLATGHKAPPIKGQLTAHDALEELLRGTGLMFEFLGERTVALSDSRAKSSSTERDELLGVKNLTDRAPSRIRLVQADTPGKASSSEARGTPEREEIEEIVVTGTHIRGTGSSTGSQVLVIDREAIERSGFATAQQALQSLPLNFQGGPNEDTFIGDAGTNVTGAASVNLRGLGADSTLLLVNGRRVPVAGANANFFDLSSIPTTAIERIEVLPDGASALYGSDAIAGVVNIILRKDYEGAETRARYGAVTDGALNELQLGQVFGANWERGNAFLSYEYYSRDPLKNTERRFAADSDLRPLGGDNFSDTFSNPGNILDPATFSPAFAIPPGQDGTDLEPGELLPGIVNFRNKNEGRNLLQDQRRHSVFTSLSQRLGENFELFAEGRYSDREFAIALTGQGAILPVPPSNPFFVDPFGGSPAVLVFYNLIDDIGPLRSHGDVRSYNGVLGGTINFGRDWELQVHGSYSRERTHIVQEGAVDFPALLTALADPDPATAFNPFGDGSHTNPSTLAGIIAAPETIDQTSEVRVANAIADGTVFDLRGGPMKLAVGADFRRELFDTEFSVPFRDVTKQLFERNVRALFAELFVPIVSETNRRPGVAALTLSLAGRFEDYDDVGTTTNPKIGLVWSPVTTLNIRGTFGTSFKAANLSDLDELFNSVLAVALPDPSAPTGATVALLQQGGNPDLNNEEATNWTVGLDFSPRAIAGLQFGLTYFNIDFEDRITSPRNAFSILLEEERFSSLINRSPTPEQIDTLCNSPLFDPSFGDCTQPIEAIIDARLNNSARTRVEGLDATVRYGFDTASMGRFDLRLDGSYLLKFEDAISNTAPAVSLLSKVNNPVDLRTRASITWTHATGLSATAFVNYIDSYTDNVSEPDRSVDSWTTIDLTLSYDTQDRFAGSQLDHTRLTLSALNLFDEEPPFVNNPQGIGYDPENADPLGRFLSLTITKRW